MASEICTPFVCQATTKHTASELNENFETSDLFIYFYHIHVKFWCRWKWVLFLIAAWLNKVAGETTTMVAINLNVASNTSETLCSLIFQIWLIWTKEASYTFKLSCNWTMFDNKKKKKISEHCTILKFCCLWSLLQCKNTVKTLLTLLSRCLRILEMRDCRRDECKIIYIMAHLWNRLSNLNCRIFL